MCRFIGPAHPYHSIMLLDLTDDEARALVAHLRHALEYDPYPYAPRLDPLKAILAKLEPSKPAAEPPPPLRSGMGPRATVSGRLPSLLRLNLFQQGYTPETFAGAEGCCCMA